MAVMFLFKKLKSVVLFFMAILKRALCCFRRRRRPSEFVPLIQVGVVSNFAVEAESWEWCDQATLPPLKPTTVQEHIEFYRQQKIAAKAREEILEGQENFFNDMAPNITKQTKYYLNTNRETDGMISKLSLDPQDTILEQELGEWDENGGWEGQTLDRVAREALKESRRKARQKKVYEQKKEKLSRPVLGAKVAS